MCIAIAIRERENRCYNLSSNNLKGGRKGGIEEQKQDKQKTNIKMEDLNPSIPIITLTVNDLSTPN